MNIKSRRLLTSAGVALALACRITVASAQVVIVMSEAKAASLSDVRAIDKVDRKTRGKFSCLDCSHEVVADLVAAGMPAR